MISVQGWRVRERGLLRTAEACLQGYTFFPDPIFTTILLHFQASQPGFPTMPLSYLLPLQEEEVQHLGQSPPGSGMLSEAPSRQSPAGSRGDSSGPGYARRGKITIHLANCSLPTSRIMAHFLRGRTGPKMNRVPQSQLAQSKPEIEISSLI